MPKPDSQSGQSLLQLMIVIAIMGVMSMIAARLTNKLGMQWFSQQLQSRLDFNAQATRRLLVSQIRDASAATVIITRSATGQGICSKVAWIDSGSSSRTVYQAGDKLYAADWSGNTCNVLTWTAQTVLKEGLKSFVVYYPNLKDPSKIGFSLVLSKQVVYEPLTYSPKYKAPQTLVLAAEVELKNP